MHIEIIIELLKTAMNELYKLKHNSHALEVEQIYNICVNDFLK